MHAELPLEIRAHAHIVLALGFDKYLLRAQEAVRVAEKGRKIFGPGKTPAVRALLEKLLEEARAILRRAELD